LPNWVAGLVAVFFPFISIPLLIIKNWDTIKGFFVSLWNNIQSVTASFVTWLNGLWNIALSVFVTAWSSVVTFFSSLWSTISSIVINFATWVGGVWDTIVSGFSVAWSYVLTFFTFIWEGIKTVILGFVNWVGGIIDFIVAPFLAAGKIIGGIFDGIGGWFKEIIGGDTTANITTTKNAVSDSTINKSTDIKTSTTVVPQSTQQKPPVLPVPAMPMANQVVPTQPVQPKPIVPPPMIEANPVIPTPITQSHTTATPIQNEIQKSVIPRKVGVNSPAVDYAASSAFTDAIAVTSSSQVMPLPVVQQTPITPQTIQSEPIVPPPIIQQNPIAPTAELSTNLDRQAKAKSQRETVIRQTKIPEPESKNGQQTIHIDIDKLYLQAEDCETLLDFARMIFHVANKHKEEFV
jgi:hypothetical protein